MCEFISVVDEAGFGNGQFDFSWVGSRAISRSAVYIILDFFSCPEKMSGQPGYGMEPGAKDNDEINLQHRAMRLTKEHADQIHSLILRFLPLLEISGSTGKYCSQISPYLLDTVYCTLATYYWFAAEEGDETYRCRISDIRQFLEKIGPRWRLGHEYLALARYHDSRMRSELLI